MMTGRSHRNLFTLFAAAVLAAAVLFSLASAPQAHSRPAIKPKAALKGHNLYRAPSTTARILVVGDSLEVGTGPLLRRQLGQKIEVYARRGRPSSEGLGVLREQIRPRHRIVVFDQGSNDDRVTGSRRHALRTLSHNMRTAHRIIGKRRCMVIATLNPKRRIYLNRFIRRFAGQHRNVVMLDWRRTIARHPDYLIDNVHSTPFGYKVRAKQMIRTLHKCR